MTTEQMKHINKSKGMFFFSPDTMRFFKSRVLEYVRQKSKKYYYFITSEKNSGFLSGESYPRQYTVRQFNAITGDITSASNFQEFNYAYQAKKWINERI